VSDSVVTKAQATLFEALAGVLAGVDRWISVDYPMHSNCGDGAIFAGQVALSRHLGIRTLAVLDRESYRASRLTEGAAVVIQGGGNWGGLYPTHHKLRLRILEDSAGYPTIQMPQSIEFADRGSRDELRRAVSRHGAFTLLVRDQRSLERAEAEYDCPVVLVPDMAFALGELTRPKPAVPLVSQARTDKEAPIGQERTEAFDWLDVPPRSPVDLALRASRRFNRLQLRTDFARGPAHLAMRTLAGANLRRGCSLLGRGEQVVTDRLHGHVLCTLMRIPHVVVGDRFGKVEALYDTWTRPDHVSRFAASWSDVPQRLSELEASGAAAT